MIYMTYENSVFTLQSQFLKNMSFIPYLYSTEISKIIKLSIPSLGIFAENKY